jgi:hypothetical protein
VFALLALACLWAGLLSYDEAGPVVLLACYPALSFGLLATAYGRARPRLLGKRRDGRRAPWVTVALLPYFALNRVTFALYRRSARGPAVAWAAPKLAFGRRLTSREAASGGWGGVLDLAAEFVEVSPLRAAPRYLSLPVLDATAPTPDQLRQAVEFLVAEGPTYVHCALGHGRTGCVVIAYLLAVELVRTPREGEEVLRRLRPGLRLNPAQRRALARLGGNAS